MKSISHWLLVVLLTPGLGSVAQADGLDVPPFHATYSVGRDSLRIGTAQFTLSHNDDGSYTYQSVTHPAGLVSLFVNDVVTETSHFEIVDGEPRSLLYSFSQTGGSHEKAESIQFEWDKSRAHVGDDGRYRTVKIAPGVSDVFLAQLRLSLDAAAGRSNAQYQVLDDSETITYGLQTLPSASLKTPAGTYQAVLLERKDAEKNRTTDFWLAPSLHYLPVQMQQKQPGKATISLVLTDMQFDGKDSK